MKKLKKMSLTSDSKLTREEMKNIEGGLVQPGYSYGTCIIYCGSAGAGYRCIYYGDRWICSHP